MFARSNKPVVNVSRSLTAPAQHERSLVEPTVQLPRSSTASVQLPQPLEMDAKAFQVVHPAGIVVEQGRFLEVPGRSRMATPRCSCESRNVIVDMNEGVHTTVQFPYASNAVTARPPLQRVRSSPHLPLVPATQHSPQILLDTTFTLSSDPDTEMDPPPAPKFNKQRYYSYALSDEDKEALASGEYNHNLKSWTPEEAIRFHEGRIELAHEGVADRDEFLAARKQDLEIAEAKKGKKKTVRKLLSFGFLKKSSSKTSSTFTDTEQAFRYSERSVSAQSLQSPSTTSLSSVSEEPARLSRPANRALNHRNVSTGDYFSARRQPQRIVSSPLTQEVGGFTPRPDITFDTFLAPHVSGKGEAFLGAENAKPLVDVMNGTDSNDRTARLTKTLSKMSSMPLLRNRKSTKSLKSPTGSTEDLKKGQKEQKK